MWDPFVTWVWHPGCINVKFLSLESTCSRAARAPFSPSCFLDHKLTRLSLMTLKTTRSGESGRASLILGVKSLVETSLKDTCVGCPVTVTLPLTIQPCDLLESCHHGSIGCLLRCSLQVSTQPFTSQSFTRFCGAHENPVENWDGFPPAIPIVGTQSLCLLKENQTDASLCQQREMAVNILFCSIWAWPCRPPFSFSVGFLEHSFEIYVCLMKSAFYSHHLVSDSFGKFWLMCLYWCKTQSLHQNVIF